MSDVNKEIVYNLKVKSDTQGVDKLNTATKETTQNMNGAKEAVGGYTSNLKIMGVNVGGMLTKLTAFKKGLIAQRVALKASATASGGFSKALKILKLALISTGVGAIVVAVGALAGAFLSTQRGSDALSRAMTPLKVIFEKFIGFVQDLSTGMVDMFTNPVEGIKKLGKMITENVLNRFKAIGIFGEAIAELFSGNLTKGLKKMADASVQLTLGVTNATDKMSDFTDEVKEANKEGQRLTDMTIQIEEKENDLIKTRGRLNRKYQESLEIANDHSKSDAERAAAATAAIQAQDELLKKEKSLNDLKTKKIKLEQSLNDTSREDLKELNTLIAEQENLYAQAAKRKKTAQSILNNVTAQSILNNVTKEAIKDTDDYRIAIEKLNQAQTEIIINTDNANAMKGYKKRAEFDVEAEKEKEKLIKNHNDMLSARKNYYAAIGKMASEFVFDSYLNGLDAELEETQNHYDQLLSEAEVYHNTQADMLQSQVDAGLMTQAEYKKALLKNDEEYSAKQKKLTAERISEENALKHKQFNAEKSSSITDIAISTAKAVAYDMAKNKFMIPWDLATGAAQTALVASKKWTPIKAASGLSGQLKGPLHASGGINLGQVEAEGGEYMSIINRASTQRYLPLLDKINSVGNSVGDSNNVGELIDYKKLASAVRNNKVYVVSHEVTEQQNIDIKTNDRIQF